MNLVEEASEHLTAQAEHNRAFMKLYPGDSPARQPVHTVYGGAQLYRADTTQRLGELALRSLDEFGGDPFAFAEGVGFAGAPLPAAAQLPQLKAAFEKDPDALRRAQPAAWLALTVYDRVRRKLEREPVEDFRIDFEDGFGARPDAEEDSTAREAGHQVALGLAQDSLPPFIGIRIKSFGEEWKRRGARTLDLFLDQLLAESGRLPPNFVVTLPKIQIAEQPRALVRMFEIL